MIAHPNEPAPPRPPPGSVPADGLILLAAAVVEGLPPGDPERQEWQRWAAQRLARPAPSAGDLWPPDPRRVGARIGRMAAPGDVSDPVYLRRARADQAAARRRQRKASRPG